jgi:hypothetical protein
MKAITIRQPCASLIMAGIKTLETRSRPTKIRGRVLIHSALKMAELTEEMRPYILKLPGYTVNKNHGSKEFNLNIFVGHILGSVEITDCIPAADWCELHNGKGNLDRYAIFEREFALGDLSSNNYVYVLKDPISLKTPFAWKGNQGIGWEFSGDNWPIGEPIALHL